MRYDHQKNLQEFRDRFGFVPSEVEWEPRVGPMLKDNRDPGKLGALILQMRSDYPLSRSITECADKVA